MQTLRSDSRGFLFDPLCRKSTSPQRTQLRSSGIAGQEESVMDHVRIFDTTLRDGEQSPGATLNLQEKLEIAHQLQALGVDIIEAGFPISSPGDFESVQAIAAELDSVVCCGLARC